MTRWADRSLAEVEQRIEGARELNSQAAIESDPTERATLLEQAWLELEHDR